MRWLDRLLVLCAGLVVAANLLPLGARWAWMLELTTHFRVQYLAATAARARARCVAPPLGRMRSPRGRRRRQRGTRAAVPAVAARASRSSGAGRSAEGADRQRLVSASSRRAGCSRLVREADARRARRQELTPHAERVLADLDTALPNYRQIPGRRPVRHRPLVALRARVGHDVRARPRAGHRGARARPARLVHA